MASHPTKIRPSSVKEEAKLWGIRVIGQNFPVLDDPARKPTIWRDLAEKQVRDGEELVEIIVRVPRG